jgi:pantoate--beta-alanine ligase
LRIVRDFREFERPAGTLGFVPTMGALHEGHLELMRRAKSACDEVAISIFVNPTQFGPNEDFSKYPRTEERDLELAESVGVDFAYLPNVESMYARTTTRIEVDGVSARWEGEFRPGHFTGVATVVGKLFHRVPATDAFFGKKDFQQCAVIRRMVDDLDFPIRLHWIDTYRESDGLAMSSRNRYLSPKDRAISPHLYRILNKCVEMFLRNPEVYPVIAEAVSELSGYGFRVQYLALVDSESLDPLTHYEPGATLIVAAFIGNTRLIDNITV